MPLTQLFTGEGEMARRMREHEWPATPLGPAQDWPLALQSPLDICLGSSFPIAIYWGPQLALLYNDAWSPILGNKHPWALGRPAREVWPEIWDTIGPLFDQVLRTGQATRSQDQLLPMHRHGFTEECWFDYTFSPIRNEHRKVEGIFNAVVETTYRHIGERRTQLLRALGEHTANAPNAAAVCKRAASTFASFADDLPFALIYLLDAVGDAHLAGHIGLEIGSPACPLTMAAHAGSAWPLAEALQSRNGELAECLSDRFGTALPGGPWPEPCELALLMPFAPSAGQPPVGVFIAGISPRLALDSEYRAFIERAAASLGTAVAGAQANEQHLARAEALAQIDRAKTAFFTNVSHELRTPLALMLGPLEDLSNSVEAEDQRELVATAQRSANRLLKLVNTLLDFSRVEGGRADATFVPIDLAAFTADLASTFRAACERAGLRLIVDCPPLPQAVHVDRDQWEKIVLNLLSNAFKFTLEGTITVSLRPSADGTHAELAVHDTGTGIPAAEMGKLFGRFQRIEGSRGRSFEGSGIGLAFVHELVGLHGGTIGAASVEGQGSTFTVRLPFGSTHLPADRVRSEATPPRGPSQVAAFVGEALNWLPEDGARSETDTALGLLSPGASAPATTHGPSGVPRILIADDNADLRAYLARLLGAHHAVETAADGLRAFEMALENPPDLVLSDVMMPGLDGFELISRLRADARTRTLPVIVLSARAGEEARIEGLAAGADDYLVKPFSGRELLARVGAHLAAARFRREAGEAVRASEMQFRALVTATSDIVYRMSPDWTQMRYLRGQEFIADTLEPRNNWLIQYIPENERARVLQVVERAIDAKSVFELEHRVIRVDGSVGWTFSRAIPILEDGEIVEWLGAATDVTPRKEAEKALREADRRKDEFLAMLAHELRNPLAPICNALHLLKLVGDRLQTERMHQMIERQVTHLVRLVDDLMEASRISRGQLELKREVVDLVEVLRTAVETSRPLIDQNRHSFHVAVPCDPLPVEGDAIRLAQIFTNLLNNAARYTDNGGQIELAAQIEGAEVQVSVRDNGVGIAANQLPRVFEMFAQLDPNHGRAQRGLGIGLSLVHRLVQMHGGRIEAASDGLGSGSVFTVRLPLTQAVATALHAPNPVGNLNARRVLVVDDNSDAADSLGMLLSFLEAEVRVEHSGAKALAAVQEWHPAVVLLDLGMPGMDGFEVARQLRADPQLHGIKLIALTGWGQQADRQQTSAAGFDHHLIKPVDINVLQTLLASMNKASD